MKRPYLTPPESIVRYPRATIFMLCISSFLLVSTTSPGIYTSILLFIAIFLACWVDDQEERRKGFFICIRQLEEMGVVTRDKIWNSQ